MSNEQVAAPKTNPFNLVNTVFLLVLLVVVMIAEFALELNFLMTWPAFMVMIFFFFAHGDAKVAPSIIVGGAWGLFNMVLIKAWIPFVMPLFGGSHHAAFYAKLLWIAIFIASIIYLKDIVAVVFNNYAFMLFTVAGAVNGGYSLANSAVAAALKASSSNPEVLAAVTKATETVMQTAPIVNIYNWILIYIGVGCIFVACIIGIFKIAGAVGAWQASRS